MTEPQPNILLEYRKSPEGIREIASRQRAILLCILGGIGFYVALIGAQQGHLPPIAIICLAGCLLAVDVASVVFVFLIATKLYGTAIGVVMGILTIVPCLGLIILLVINAKATAILKAAGLKVGLLGASVPKSL